MQATDIPTMFEGLCEEWKNILCRENKELFGGVMKQLMGVSITPGPEKVFEAFRLTSFADTKVVIMGQDPYPTAATGLAFSVDKDAPIPGSLANIGKAVVKSGYKFDSGDLTNWAKQGVLLMNMAMTTELGVSNAHTKIWLPWTKKIIKDLMIAKSKTGEQLIFILWGNDAMTISKIIDAVNFDNINNGLSEHKYAMWSHPSPAATLNNGNPDTCRKHFANTDSYRKTNEWLIEMKKTPIDWST